MSAVAASGIVRSPLLAAVPGVAHGFTTRDLGSMAGSVFSPEEQARNRERLAAHLGMPLAKASQVHSADVVLVSGGRAVRLADGKAEGVSSAMSLAGDALITRSRGIALSVAIADCVPVLLVTPDGWVGAAHAGWDGATRGVLREMLDALRSRGADLASARAAIGPSIGPCCYEIDGTRADVVRDRLGRRRAERVLVPRGDRFVLDLWLACALQLRDAGVGAVDALDACTRDGVARFFSHRGEQGRAGRGLAFIGWKPR